MSLRDRKVIENTYTDTCTVFEFEDIKEKGITKKRRFLKFQGIKCALSTIGIRTRTISTTNQTDIENNISYDAKLFLSPEVEIKAGSRIEVSRLGRIFKFQSTGEAFIYETHQEIMLKRKDKA